ncbi:Nif3-like dinuclear metal center hexameric protein [Prosthecochloris sp. SCSIO W1101]|uniref:Nif3-like dinuclear metal center hexameric protein n=1 Tax=Prosthecochloris sp. SCSIO W1101 TaxID=2992242 RepID=UPI00223E7595|nr:Nif3-like dinuclear metal center hexameric protein [Prosthecochloris sp. SCSIO W1101]UZJ41616.1 Nif3-like dinuclear metal center hexameric protein [Prosthecochloris sp. SCSIO W1101]
MKLLTLTSKLDIAFRIAENTEDLVEWAVTDSNRRYVHPAFLEGRTGLMLQGGDIIQKAYTAVFVSDRVVEKILRERNCLLFTHHHFNYYEDERGLQPISPETMEALCRAGHSLYVAHAPLDTHARYGTSIALAELTGITVEHFFYDYFGAPTALVGHVTKTGFQDFASRVCKELQRPYLTLQQHRPAVEKVAVAAGGGDLPDLLQYAYDAGCDTLLTGTVENRWAVPSFQELNRAFHELNTRLKLNLIGGTHFGTERPAMLAVTELFETYGICCEYCEDELLLEAV